MLEPLTPETAGIIAGWVNSPAEAIMMGGPLLPWPLTAEDLLAIAADPAREVFVLPDHAGRVVATGSFQVPPDRGVLRIGRVIVDPDRRGEGWGRALLTALLDRADADPTVMATSLGVFERNAIARGLYLSLGFAPNGTVREVQVEGELWQALDLERPCPER